jgi:cell division protein FtsQ
MTAMSRPRTRAEAWRERRARAAGATRTYKAAGARSPRILMGSTSGGRRRSRGRSRYERAGVLPAISLVLPELPSVRLDWRTASLAIVIMFGALLFYVLSTPSYFVNAVNLAGATYVSAEEIYEASELNRMHIFWVEPALVQANIEQVPGIAAAQVELAWPNQVTITVTERAPVLEWREDGDSVWVDRGGVIFPARAEIPGLLPVVVEQAEAPPESEAASADKAGEAEPEAEAAEPLATVPVEAIAGALQLRELRPNIEQLYFDPAQGLSYQDGRGWRGYFGVGTDMAVKLAVYETLVADLVSRGVQPLVINVANADAPYYSSEQIADGG